MYRSSSPYRAASPYQTAPPQNDPYSQPQYSPSPGGQSQIIPGSVTYTTSQGADGRVIYHPFKAVAASYQTPNGIVSGIQWVPAEATQILPAGAQPANSDFTASWNRGHLSKDDQRALKDWQRDEDKQRKKEEKESRRLRDKDRGPSRGDPDYELRKARERDSMVRERRKSFNAGAAGMPLAFPVAGTPNTGYPQTGGAGYPTTAYSGYDRPSTTSPYGPGPGSSPVAYERPGTASPYGPNPGATASAYVRDRKYSTGGGVLSGVDGQFGDMNLDRDREHGGDKASGLGRPRKYSTNDGPTATERARTISGNYGDRPSPYSAAGTYAPSIGPYSRPYSAAPGSANNYPGSGSQYPGHSPNMRPSEVPYVPPQTQGYSNPNYPTSSPNRSGADPYARSTTPFGSGGGPGSSPLVYPRGHVMEGQPVPRSRATTPIPGTMGPPGFPSAPIPFPQPGTSPHMPEARAFPSEGGRLAAPEGFSRPINAAQPYTPFETMKIQDMDDFIDHIPRMPLVLQPHDVYHEDWIRMMQDLSLAWAGRLPVPELSRSGRTPRRTTLAADLIDLWNSSFFLARGVEVVLYKGQERRSGSLAGQIDRHLPSFNDDDDSSSSSSTSSSSESDEGDRDRDKDRYPLVGPYSAYSRSTSGQGQISDSFDARRRRREAKAEKKKRRRERKARRKARARQKKYGLYLVCVSQNSPGAMGPGMPQVPLGYGGMPGGIPGGMLGGHAGSSGGY